MTIILTIILIALGMLKAIRDRLETGRRNIFPKEGIFWNKGTGKKVLGLHFDAWHLSDALYILLFCIAISIGFQLLSLTTVNAILYFVITQTSFTVFYYLFGK